MPAVNIHDEWNNPEMQPAGGGGKPLMVTACSGQTRDEWEESVELRRELLGAAGMDAWNKLRP